MKVSSTILGEISSVISIIPLGIFHSRFWTFFIFIFWFSIHTPSRDIKSFVRYLHMQRQLHLLTLWECWKEKLRYTIVFSTAILCHTDAAAAADVWAFLLLCGNTNPIFSVNKEDELGRRMICPPNLNVLCNTSKFSVNHYHWANYRIWEFTTVWMCVPFATPKKSSVLYQCLQFCRGL